MIYRYIIKNRKCISVVMLFLAAHSACLTAQIGILTENIPANTLFIVDGARDNPITGAANAAAQANDVVVDNLGRFGVGTHNPTAKLHINTNGQANMFGFRLDRNAQMGNVTQYLLGGNTGWVEQAVTQNPIESIIDKDIILTTSSITNLTGTNLPFTAPRRGLYSFEIRFWGRILTVPTNTPRYDVRILLRCTKGASTVTVDSFRFANIINRQAITSTCTLFVLADENDVINVAVEPIVAQQQITTGQEHTWTTCKVRIIEMQVENGEAPHNH